MLIFNNASLVGRLRKTPMKETYFVASFYGSREGGVALLYVDEINDFPNAILGFALCS